jgi:transposase
MPVRLANPEPKVAYVRAKSLIASAERHQVDPQRYLTSVLAKIGQKPTAELDQFLPDVWKREDAAEHIS